MKCCQEIKVSIIMPSLNVAPYIRECIDSAVNQSLKKIEIICIDAGSTDGTREIIAEYAKKDNRIKCIDSVVKSYGYQVNMGIQAAKGEYIAVLETDDYVDTMMYENLYSIAADNDLDYVKADFDVFAEYDANKVFSCWHMFSNKDKYNRVVNGRELPEIFTLDQSIWRGIYKREFLNNSNIRLNDSPGAAYQDIGFVLSVMTSAKRSMYISDSYYRYRLQREGCSSCSDKILQFSYQEFARLIDEMHFDNTDVFKYIALRMAGVFLVEYNKLLSKYDYAFDKNFYEAYVEKYYIWFKDRLSACMAENVIGEADMSAADWKELNLLINNPTQYALVKKHESDKREEYINGIIKKINNRNVVIVSCGTWGKRALELLLNRNVNVVSFGDNNSSVWNTYVAGIKVQSLTECTHMYKDAVYVIANKRFADVLSQQLTDLGISEDNMVMLSF